MATDKNRIDLFRLHKEEYAAPKKPAVVAVGAANYLSVAGTGGPAGAEFETKIGALYAAAYTVKMTRKFAGLQDYVIGKLECRWTLPGGGRRFDEVPVEQWLWRMLIRTPDFVGKRDLNEAVKKLVEKGKGEGSEHVELHRLPREKCVQMLHVGPYDREGETVERMLARLEEEGLVPGEVHHEIYLSDPRRVAPEKLRTIFRLPLA